MKTSWTRLIRFVAAEDSQIHLGQPIDSELDVGVAAHNGEKFEAYEITGDSAYDPESKLTDRKLTVSKLLTPLDREKLGIIRCLGLNYEDHAREVPTLQKSDPPFFFCKPPSTLIGPDDTIPVPKIAQPAEKYQPDYEIELTIVIGKAAKDVSQEDAMDYVLGYTGANDQSYRHYFLVGKQFDDATPLGPCIVAEHTIPDPQKLRLTTTMNGKLMQNGTTSDMMFGIRYLVAFLSQATTLPPGSLIMTGTPAGVGFARQPAVYMQHGDKMEFWFDGGIGTLFNEVVDEK